MLQIDSTMNIQRDVCMCTVYYVRIKNPGQVNAMIYIIHIIEEVLLLTLDKLPKTCIVWEVDATICKY